MSRNGVWCDEGNMERTESVRKPGKKKLTCKHIIIHHPIIEGNIQISWSPPSCYCGWSRIRVHFWITIRGSEFPFLKLEARSLFQWFASFNAFDLWDVVQSLRTSQSWILGTCKSGIEWAGIFKKWVLWESVFVFCSPTVFNLGSSAIVKVFGQTDMFVFWDSLLRMAFVSERVPWRVPASALYICLPLSLSKWVLWNKWLLLQKRHLCWGILWALFFPTVDKCWLGFP